MKWFPVLTVALFLGVAAWAAGDGALFPADGFAVGWSKDGASKLYEKEALYDHIDGGGEVFLEIGFEACSVQRYGKGPQTFTLEIYRMTDTAAALGIYQMNCGKETPDKAFAERHTVGRNQLLCVKGRYYLVATSPDASPGLPQALVAAARVVTEKLPAADPPACLSLLPKEGLVPRSERILRGPIALQAIVTLGDGDVLLLRGGATAVTADYKDKAGALSTLIVAQYSSAEAATAALRNLSARLDPQFTPVGSSGKELAFKDGSGKAGRAEADGPRLTLRLSGS